jgi:hypothetical protein
MLKYYLQNFQKELSKTIVWILQKHFGHFEAEIKIAQEEDFLLSFYVQTFKKIFNCITIFGVLLPFTR